MADGLARAGFDIDLKDGLAREDAFAHVLMRANVDWTKIKHKSDQVARRTGNLFVEFREKGRPSGIATTEADLWAVEFDDNCWSIIPTAKMKQYAKEAIWQGKVTEGGDRNNCTGALIPIQWIVGPRRPGR